MKDIKNGRLIFSLRAHLNPFAVARLLFCWIKLSGMSQNKIIKVDKSCVGHSKGQSEKALINYLAEALALMNKVVWYQTEQNH